MPPRWRSRQCVSHTFSRLWVRSLLVTRWLLFCIPCIYHSEACKWSSSCNKLINLFFLIIGYLMSYDISDLQFLDKVVWRKRQFVLYLIPVFISLYVRCCFLIVTSLLVSPQHDHLISLSEISFLVILHIHFLRLIIK